MPVIINGSTGITNVNGSASTPAETGTDTDTGIYYGTNTVGLATNGTNALFIDSSQNVGINTSSPSTYGKFAVAGQSSLGVDQADYVNVLGASGTARVETSGSSANSNLAFSTKGTGAIYFWRGGYGTTISAIIDGSGNVGIGTSSPSTPLDVVQKTSDTTYALQLRGYTTGADGVRTANMRAVDSANANWANMGSYATSWIWNYQGTAERMRLDSSGNLLVGTTSTSVTSGGYNFLINDGGTGYSTGYIGHITGCPSGYAYLNFKYAGTTIGTITQNGTTAVAYNTSSDYRLKHDIAPMTGALAKVAALKPVTYKWNTDDSDGEGFIAHELAEVCPHAVTGAKDAVDAEGNPVYQGIDTSFLVATLTAAIQEQQVLITALTARIEALENK